MSAAAGLWRRGAYNSTKLKCTSHGIHQFGRASSMAVCTSCGGTGSTRCSTCWGKGTVPCQSCQSKDAESRKACTNCSGRGTVLCSASCAGGLFPCHACGQTGQVPDPKPDRKSAPTPYPLEPIFIECSYTAESQPGYIHCSPTIQSQPGHIPCSHPTQAPPSQPSQSANQPGMQGRNGPYC